MYNRGIVNGDYGMRSGTWKYEWSFSSCAPSSPCEPCSPAQFAAGLDSSQFSAVDDFSCRFSMTKKMKQMSLISDNFERTRKSGQRNHGMLARRFSRTAILVLDLSLFYFSACSRSLVASGGFQGDRSSASSRPTANFVNSFTMHRSGKLFSSRDSSIV